MGLIPPPIPSTDGLSPEKEWFDTPSNFLIWGKGKFICETTGDLFILGPLKNSLIEFCSDLRDFSPRVMVDAIDY